VNRPAPSRLGLPLHHPASLIATWFGTGLLPLAPGTWASLVALPFGWAIAATLGPVGLFAAALAAFLAGWWAASRLGAAAAEDEGAIVIDEVAGQWLVLVATPRHLLAYATAFLLFRVADIGKPWPASWADRKLHSGLGVMLDDAFAALYAGVALWLLARLDVV
jgi:phosphatidylglycerophosphatase A